MRRQELALIAAGGAVGATARYGIADAFPVEPGRFPITTFAINVGGTFLLAALLEWLLRHRGLDHWSRFAVGIGALGAFTTFSTFALEITELARGGDGALATGYAIASVVAGAAAVVGGLMVAGWRGRPPIPDEGEG